MKKLFLLFVITSTWFSVQAQQPFTLKGDVKSLKTGDKVYLSNFTAHTTDSAEVVDGKFEFKGLASEPVEVRLSKNRTARSSDYLNLYLEPGNIIVRSSDSLKLALPFGTPANLDNNTFKSAIQAYVSKLNNIKSEPRQFSPAQLEDKALMDKLMSRYMQALLDLNAATISFIKNNPQSYISLVALTKTLSDIGPLSISDEQVFGEIEGSFSKLSNELKVTEKGKELTALLKEAKKTSVGAMAMDFAQNNPDGKLVKLSDFKGKYVLLDFWASWCIPCRAENPNLVEAYSTHKNDNFTILSVSLDKEGEKAAWLKAIKDDGLTWTQVSDLKHWNNEVSKAWGITSVPASFLIDPSGKIIAKNLRGKALRAKLDEIFIAKGK